MSFPSSLLLVKAESAGYITLDKSGVLTLNRLHGAYFKDVL